jgi:hypothetical protein
MFHSAFHTAWNNPPCGNNLITSRSIGPDRTASGNHNPIEEDWHEHGGSIA